MMNLEQEFSETDNITENNDGQKAFAYVARVIGMKSFSECELRKKLAGRSFSDEAAEYAITRLKELHLINDEQYAADIANHYKTGGYGKGRVRQELFRRGIAREIIENILDNEAEDEAAEENFINEFLAKKLSGRDVDRKMLSKAAAALMRRGFTWERISSAIRRYTDEL